MISTRRVVAAVGLAAGFAGLAAPTSGASDNGAPDTGRISPMATLDSAAATGLPAGRQGRIPKVSEQLGGPNRIGSPDGPGQLGRRTELVAPVTGLLPGLWRRIRGDSPRRGARRADPD
ncbi:hypothetical protein [Streptomyces sp. NPDC059168]|uniref:hypothetical protein n=1 Tax=Streptomyces sp. NPDC059168 TaxID=3346753 RepID=UPI00369B27C7